eukprot:9490333-Alexandrium_andersonii.AAC.1
MQGKVTSLGGFKTSKPVGHYWPTPFKEPISDSISKGPPGDPSTQRRAEVPSRRCQWEMGRVWACFG